MGRFPCELVDLQLSRRQTAGMLNLPLPPGFRGLRDDLPLHIYQRHLPHWRQDGATYFVTFRLNDSLPQAKLRELRQLRADWERRHPPPRSHDLSEQFTREVVTRVERWLDQGIGSCVLRTSSNSEIVVEDLHHFDGDRYELGCYVVMPNHVHAIVRPLAPASMPLEKILQSWKRHSSQAINKLLRKTGSLWQDESFDRIIRDDLHLYQSIQYIGRNPAKAKLTAQQTHLWIRPAWAALGWRFEDWTTHS